MKNNFNLLESLIENDSIKIGVVAKDWQDAISLAIAPLIKSGAVLKKYVTAIIDSTIKYGPYYLIAEGLAMPHARPEDGVIRDSFSLITLKKPIKFLNDQREIRILIALGATSSDIHVSSALPQVVAVFEDPKRLEDIANAKTSAEIIALIKDVDFSKYQ